jgi:NADH-quinone oxidoreductase subunit J
MTMDQWIFWPIAVLALSSALVVVVTSNAVHSALATVANLFAIAVFYVMLDAHFLAAAQVIVYAGAVMVLFLFVVMLLGVDRREELTETIPGQRVLGFLAVAGIGALSVLVLRGAFERTTFVGLEQVNAGGNVEAVGRQLFQSYLWPFEITSVLLLIAAIAAMVIGRKRPSRELTEEDAAA